jgi:hypothetical protein
MRAAERQGDHPSAIAYPFGDIARPVHLPAILAMTGSGVMGGCGGRQFCPNTVVDRAEMAGVMQRVLQVADADRDVFSDDDGLPAEPAINALAAAGVVNGCGDGSRFCVTGKVTRGQLASFLVRALDR